MRLPRLLITATLSMWVCIGHASMLSEELKARYPGEQHLALSAGEDALTVLQTSSRTTLPRGVAIILVETGYQGLTIPGAWQLSQRMSRWGWHVLIAPVEINTVAQNTENGAPTEITRFTDSSHSWVDASGWDTQVMLILNAAFAAVDSEPGYRLVISQGMSAASVLKLDAQNKLPATDSLVTIAPFWPQAGLNQRIAQYLKDSPTPVLDISGGLRNRWSALTASERARQATVNLKLHYRQQAISDDFAGSSLDTQLGSVFVNQVGKTIYGWVDYLGW